jgi:hypothetical protein
MVLPAVMVVAWLAWMWTLPPPLTAALSVSALVVLFTVLTDVSTLHMP